MAKTDANKTGTKSATGTASDKQASPERVAAFRTGLSAESRAAAYLMAKENITDIDAVAARITDLAGATQARVLGNVRGTTPLIANNGAI